MKRLLLLLVFVPACESENTEHVTLDYIAAVGECLEENPDDGVACTYACDEYFAGPCAQASITARGAQWREALRASCDDYTMAMRDDCEGLGNTVTPELRNACMAFYFDEGTLPACAPIAPNVDDARAVEEACY